MTDFFFISTPLHLMMAANLAIQSPARKHVAVLIAKQPESLRRHADCARRFPQLFQEVIALPAPAPRPTRFRPGAGFRILKDRFSRPMDARIFTGNDRRIEFQYAMHLAARANPGVEGVYLDEGAVTYTGHKSIRSFQHRHLDPLFKKLFCGFWYQNALTTGTSAWIRTAYVAFPEAVHPLLKSKRIVAMDPAPFRTELFRALALEMLEGHEDYRERLAGIRVVLTLPHEGRYLRRPEAYRQIAGALMAGFPPAAIAVKPHPRITQPALIQQMFPGATLLDHVIGMEALLPLLRDDCIVAGDVSSTLLTTRWLRPDLPVVAIQADEAPPDALLGLFTRLKIPLVRPGQWPEWLAHPGRG